MKLTGVHQIVVGATAGDAITTMALNLRDALRTLGQSEVYAHHRAPEMHGQVLPLDDLPELGHEGVIIYHASFGEPAVTRVLLQRQERLVIAYHNITPADYFVEHSPQFAIGLQWGRHEMTLLRDRVTLTMTDSAFSARELGGMGYDDVHVLPAGLRPSRLSTVLPDGQIAAELSRRCPEGFVLAVSQVLPHKRFEVLIAAMHLVQWVHDLPLGLVIVGAHRMDHYTRALEAFSRQLNLRDVWLAGGVSDRGLASAYRMAHVFATTSGHEGLAVPPLEAMSFGLPVVATGSGALSETIGDAGIVVPPDAGPELISEAIAEVVSNSTLRAELRHRGRERVRAVESGDPATRVVDLITKLIDR